MLRMLLFVKMFCSNIEDRGSRLSCVSAHSRSWSQYSMNPFFNGSHRVVYFVCFVSRTGPCVSFYEVTPFPQQHGHFATVFMVNTLYVLNS